MTIIWSAFTDAANNCLLVLEPIPRGLFSPGIPGKERTDLFFIALTRNPIAENFQGVEYSISLSNIDSLIATIITDGFMSRYSTDRSGFSIIESLFINRQDVEDIVLSEVIYDKKENILFVVKPTL